MIGRQLMRELMGGGFGIRTGLCLCLALADLSLRSSGSAPLPTAAVVQAELTHRNTSRRSPAQGSPAPAGNLPELPRVFLDTTMPPPPRRVIYVAAGGDLQQALEEAHRGDAIRLQAGAVFRGSFVLPDKGPGASWIAVETDLAQPALPAPGTRVSPSGAGKLAKILSGNSAPAISAANGAHHYRFVGLEIGVSEEVRINRNVILLGNGSQRAPESLPAHIIFDRCYIHGNPTGDIRRGLAMNGNSIAVIDSYFSDFHEVGADTQALGGWNGQGPFKIVNNYLEAAGENVIFGGADPAVPGLVSEDIEIRRNHFYKPVEWRARVERKWSVKNLFELKNARRVLIEGNVFENNWAGAQVGFAILLTPKNQDGGCPQCVVADVTFRNNLILHSANGINISGALRDGGLGQTSQRILIRDNVFEDINGPAWGDRGILLQMTSPIAGAQDIVFEHNTAFNSGSVLTVGELGVVHPGFIFRNNICLNNGYGVKGSGAGAGSQTLDVYFPKAVFEGNVFVGGTAGAYPKGNFTPSKIGDLEFVDFNGGNYRLGPKSRFRQKGTDGKDIGADIEALERETRDAGPLNRRP